MYVQANIICPQGGSHFIGKYLVLHRIRLLGFEGYRVPNCCLRTIMQCVRSNYIASFPASYLCLE